MDFSSIILLLAAIAILSFSTKNIFAMPLSIKDRWILLALRTLFVFLIVLALFEPAFVLERIEKSSRDIPVLIDESKSMTLFSPAQSIDPLLGLMRTWNESEKSKEHRFVFYGFGDSLRPVRLTKKGIQYNDHRSYFPESMKDKKLRNAPGVILISDGNWSNASLPIDELSQKPTFFLALPSINHKPYIGIAILNPTSSTSIDSGMNLMISCEGQCSSRTSLAVTVHEQNRIISSRIVELEKGNFRKELKLSIPKTISGRHLYRVSANLTEDSCFAQSFFIHTVVPNGYRYALFSASPSLDQRFLNLALKQQSDMIQSSSDETAQLDCMIFFDWSDSAQKAFKRLALNGVAAFIGALPVSSISTVPGEHTVVIRSPKALNATPFDGLAITGLPPLSEIIYTPNSFMLNQDVPLSAIIEKNDKKIDTIDLISIGRWSNHLTMICAGKNLWQWDFLPLGMVSSNERPFPFSNRLIAMLRELLQTAASNQFFLYPSSPVLETDSISFKALFPTDIPLSSKIDLLVKIAHYGASIVDSTISLIYSGAQFQTFKIGPIPQGSYLLSARLMFKGRSYNFSDSLQILKDQSEYLISGQNRLLLQEIGTELNQNKIIDIGSLLKMVTEGTDEGLKPIKETIHFQKNWLLLLLIFAVFAIELLLRRVWKLE